MTTPDAEKARETREWVALILEGLVSGADDHELLDGRDFDEAYWQKRYEALDSLAAALAVSRARAEKLEEALREAFTGLERATFDAHDREWSRVMMDRIRDLLEEPARDR